LFSGQNKILIGVLPKGMKIIDVEINQFFVRKRIFILRNPLILLTTIANKNFWLINETIIYSDN